MLSHRRLCHLVTASVLLAIISLTFDRSILSTMRKVSQGSVNNTCQCSCNDTIMILFTVSNGTRKANMIDPSSNIPIRTHWNVSVISGTNLVQVTIMEKEPNIEYSVLAVMKDKFTQSAFQVLPHGSTSLIYYMRLPFAGEYHILVHKIFESDSFRRDFYSPVVPSSQGVKVVVSHDICPVMMRRKDPHTFPPCQTVNNDVLTRWEGDWLGPAHKLQADIKMRTEWSFLPRACKLETFTTDDLEASSLLEKTSIAVLGTSQDRGIFLSMVDMALRGEEKSAMPSSELGKCWGQAHVRLNNLEFIYQDARTIYIDPFEDPATVTCHGENIAHNSKLFENITIVIKKLMEKESPPQVVLISSGCAGGMDDMKKHDNPLNCMIVSKKIVDSFPKDWNGTIYFSTQFISGLPPRESREHTDNYYHNMQFFGDYVNDTRARVLDLYSLTDVMRLHAEWEGKIYASNHLHRWCDHHNSDMVVCSNVTEALANLLIGRAIAPEGKAAWMQKRHHAGLKLSETLSEMQREILTCSDCPESLVPFHVKTEPNFTCTTGNLLISYTSGDVWNLPPCPLQCMAASPRQKYMTQSGPVDVRVCTITS